VVPGNAWPQALAVVLVLLVAGCLGAGDTPGTDGAGDGGVGGGDGDGGPVTPQNGVIRGRVVTDDLDPVEGADVYLLSNNTLHGRTNSSATGQYEFTDVPPGDYRLRVDHACCEEGTQSVFLKAGETRQTDIKLKAFPIQRPYVDPLQWNGFMACGVAINNNPPSNLACGDPQHDVIHEFVAQQGLRSIVIGMDWTPGGTMLDPALRLYVERHTAGANWYEYARITGPPPHELHIGPGLEGEHAFENIDDDGWRFRFTVRPAGSLNVIYQQPFEVHYHLHYWAEAPEGASALPD
jgi:hypothetical protein